MNPFRAGDTAALDFRGGIGTSCSGFNFGTFTVVGTGATARTVPFPVSASTPAFSVPPVSCFAAAVSAFSVPPLRIESVLIVLSASSETNRCRNSRCKPTFELLAF